MSTSQIDSFAGGRLTVQLAADKFTVAEWLTNDYAIPIVVDIRRELSNLRPSGEVLRAVIVPAHGVIRVALWEIEDTTLAWNERSRLHTEMGSPSARPRDYLYGLPFAAGETHLVHQAFNGTFSHTADRAFAVDFAMPEGTLVRASREGVVVAYNDKARTHSLDQESRDRVHANWIAVLHDDGTLGEYWHLLYDGVLVRIGQHVARGDVIGKSGFTGYARNPHLHFTVKTARDGLHVRSFPFLFKIHPNDTTGSAPVEGTFYTAFE